MNRSEIFEQLTTIFREIFEDNTIVLDENMTSNDIEKWDSLTHMLMIEEVEECFGIKFKIKELNKLKRVGDMLDILESKLQS